MYLKKFKDLFFIYFKDVEKELELQIGMKQEMEMALRILEKDIHEKQDTMISLRKQLDEIKAINLEMYQKLQVKLVISDLFCDH